MSTTDSLVSLCQTIDLLVSLCQLMTHLFSCVKLLTHLFLCVKLLTHLFLCVKLLTHSHLCVKTTLSCVNLLTFKGVWTKSFTLYQIPFTKKKIIGINQFCVICEAILYSLIIPVYSSLCPINEVAAAAPNLPGRRHQPRPAPTMRTTEHWLFLVFPKHIQLLNI